MERVQQRCADDRPFFDRYPPLSPVKAPGDNLQINNDFCNQTLDFFLHMHYYIVVVEYNFLGKENAKKLR